ncbi:MAG: hypothetical protein JSR19_10025 [Proteobacteria bacterium]|nr:hypothetical protein [Pseudomonadota bacterium]HQR03203.1 hypothetical protein [Rhodocyclaceae bacterium]
MLLAFLLGLALIFHLWRDAGLIGHRFPVALLPGEAGSIELHFRSGITENWQIGPDSVVWSWMVVLDLRRGGQRSRRMVLMPDHLGDEGHRKLRRWLRWQTGKAA